MKVSLAWIRKEVRELKNTMVYCYGNYVGLTPYIKRLPILDEQTGDVLSWVEEPRWSLVSIETLISRLPQEDDMDSIDPYKEWKDKEKTRDYLGEIMDVKNVPKEFTALASTNPVIAKRVKYTVDQRYYHDVISIEVREKMVTIDIKAYIENIWAEKFRLNSCKCHLPGHKDSTPSFHVYPNTHSWYCFWCATGGSLIDFMMKNNKIDLLTAIKYVKAL